MYNIRYGVFETNSSSCHSVVITANDNMKQITEDEAGETGFYHCKSGVLNYEDLEFNQGPFMTNSWIDKLGYYLTYEGEWTFEELCRACYGVEDMIRRHAPQFTEIKFGGKTLTEIEKLIKASQNDEDGDKLYWRGYDNDFISMYIDHQSQNMFPAIPASLEDFIFNDKYILIIDWDDCTFSENAEKARNDIVKIITP